MTRAVRKKRSQKSRLRTAKKSLGEQSLRTKCAVRERERLPSARRRLKICGTRRACAKRSPRGPAPTIQAIERSRTSPKRREAREKLKSLSKRARNDVVVAMTVGKTKGGFSASVPLHSQFPGLGQCQGSTPLPFYPKMLVKK